jgi:hypothetical protein
MSKFWYNVKDVINVFGPGYNWKETYAIFAPAGYAIAAMVVVIAVMLKL